MMSSLENRLERARKHAGMTQRQVADHFRISSQAIAQWESGRARPDSRRPAALARLFGVRLEWLLDGSGPMTEEDSRAGAARDQGTSVPVIDRVRAGGWTEVGDPYAPGAGDDFILTDLSVSPHTFALEIEGQSMTPEFQPGDKIIIDPEVEPRPGEFVVAKREQDQEVTFKKYRLRGYDDKGQEIIELRPLNDDFPSLFIDTKNPGRIVGTMVEHRRYRSG